MSYYCLRLDACQLLICQIREIEAQSYEENPALLQIKLAEIIAGSINQGDAIIYVPEGSSLSNVLISGGNNDQPVIPVQP